MRNPSTDTGAHVVIEKTGRKWKKLLLWSWALLIVGIISVAACTSKVVNNPVDKQPGPDWLILNMTIFALSIALWIRAKIAIWWYHS